MLPSLFPPICVSAATPPVQAVDEYNDPQNTYDAILLDIHMPIMDGIAATHALRKGGCKLPIVALTANVERTREVCPPACAAACWPQGCPLGTSYFFPFFFFTKDSLRLSGAGTGQLTAVGA